MSIQTPWQGEQDVTGRLRSPLAELFAALKMSFDERGLNFEKQAMSKFKRWEEAAAALDAYIDARIAAAVETPS